MAGEAPTPTAASSLDHPRAIAVQKRTISSPRAAVGRPGDRNASRLERSERRFRMFIATSSIEVLRRPFESAQYCSVDDQSELRNQGIRISMSGKGNCYDNAMVETFFKTLKSEHLADRLLHSHGR
jgi:hypothetical protein